MGQGQRGPLGFVLGFVLALGVGREPRVLVPRSLGPAWAWLSGRFCGRMRWRPRSRRPHSGPAWPSLSFLFLPKCSAMCWPFKQSHFSAPLTHGVLSQPSCFSFLR